MRISIALCQGLLFLPSVVGFVFMSGAKANIGIHRKGLESNVALTAKANAAVAAAALCILGGSLPASAALTGAAIFQSNCAACHIAGMNIIDFSKTLKTDALAKNGYTDADKIETLLQNGAGAMPRYSEYTKKNGDLVPAKLSASEMEEVSTYVLKRASENWQ